MHDQVVGRVPIGVLTSQLARLRMPELARQLNGTTCFKTADER